MTEERKGVLFVFVAAVLYSLGGLCIKLIPDWSGLALNAGRNGIALVVYVIFFAALGTDLGSTAGSSWVPAACVPRMCCLLWPTK